MPGTHDTEAKVEQLLSDPDKALIIQVVQGFIEYPHQRPVISPHRKVGQSTEIELGFGQGILDCETF